MPTSPSPRSEQLGTPKPPAIRSTRVKYFGASRFTHLLRPAKLLAPLYGSDRYARPPGAFTSRLPTDWLPSPLLDMTTTATGLLCWRGLSPARMSASLAAPEPDLNLSIHPARATARRLPPSVENWSSSCCQLARSQRRGPAPFAPRALPRFLAT